MGFCNHIYIISPIPNGQSSFFLIVFLIKFNYFFFLFRSHSTSNDTFSNSYDFYKFFFIFFLIKYCVQKIPVYYNTHLLFLRRFRGHFRHLLNIDVLKVIGIKYYYIIVFSQYSRRVTNVYCSFLFVPCQHPYTYSSLL